MTARKLKQADVQKLHDALMAANSAEPYVHANYAAIEARLREANRKYYGDALAERAREVQLDCGEVWTRETLVRYEIAAERSELETHVDWLVWATEEDYIQKLSTDIDADTDRILALDPLADVGAWIDLAAARVLRDKAAEMGGRPLRETNATIEHDAWLGLGA